MARIVVQYDDGRPDQVHDADQFILFHVPPSDKVEKLIMTAQCSFDFMRAAITEANAREYHRQAFKEMSRKRMEELNADEQSDPVHVNRKQPGEYRQKQWERFANGRDPTLPDMTGKWSEEKCPRCGARLLVNGFGQKWCSNAGDAGLGACDYGLKASTEEEETDA
ncbi:hypothetical protein [Cohnella sp. GCM10012308]|uniref:hypothetical protein n=1 Tax=Cohnella sp. GCM10012308 TaxID=3317329 RepID=UPI003623AAA0